MFHKEGFKIILITLISVITASLLAEYFIATEWLKIIIQVAAILILVLILQFFRNPKRYTVINHQQIIAPSDGKIVIIKKVFENEYFKDERMQISIFMSPINVHVTRYPTSGIITFSKYHPGKYLVAWNPKSSEKNERTTIVVKNPAYGEVLYRQIAGFLARRIVNYAKKDMQVTQGTDAGFIKFGSRIDVFLPLNADIKVQLNQKVKGGTTVLTE